MTLKIKDLPDNVKEKAVWKTFSCNCETDPECKACQFKKAEGSIPNDEFIVKQYDLDGNELPDKTVKEIRVIRGKYGDCMGWTF